MAGKLALSGMVMTTIYLMGFPAYGSEVSIRQDDHEGVTDSQDSEQYWEPQSHILEDESFVSLSLDSILINDKLGGNGNGIIEPGETIQILVVAKNGSFRPLSGLKGSIKITSGSGISLKASSLTYDTIPANSTAPNKEPAILVVDKKVECGSQFQSSFTLIADGSSVSISKQFKICN